VNGFSTPALLFGIILLVASISLFFWGRLKPELARDADNVYSILGIICAVILFISAFELNLIQSFQQLLMIGSVISLMWENIRTRTPNLDARSGGSSFPGMKRDDDRSSSRRPYRAERANEYEEFGASPGRGSAGLEGGRRDRDGYGDGGYSGSGGSGGYDVGNRSLPRRESRDDRPSNDRSGSDRPTNDRPSRRNSGDDDFARGRDDSFDNEPRSIPERSSRPARDSGDSTDRPRRRRSSSSSNEETDRPRRRSSQVEDVRGNNDDIPAADYAEFTPLEIKPEKPAGSSWGPGG
jgi:hypothetical protein